MNLMLDFDCDFILKFKFGPRIKFEFEICKITKRKKEIKKEKESPTWAETLARWPTYVRTQPA
jgi:hypothetical protein